MLQLAGIAIDAVSVGGLATCIQLPGFDLAFDMGRSSRAAVNRSTVLFTHAHVDHMGSVVQHCATRSMMGMKPPTYVLPAENVADFHALLDVWRRLDGSDLRCTVVPARPGDTVALPKGRVARPFRSPHRVVCQGYAIYAQRKRLRADLDPADRAAIRAARDRGEDVTERFESCELVFTGDTLIEAVEQHEAVRKARVLIMEVTFIDDRVSVAQCRSKGHIHLDEVIERADLFENDAILFTHLSARYDAATARQILARRLPPSLRERVTLLEPPEHL